MDLEKIEAEAVEHDILQYLVDSELLEGPALGVARQVLAQGRSSLVGRQVSVFRFIERDYFEMDCGRCGIPMPKSEVLTALMEDDDYCGWCSKMRYNQSRED